MYSKLKAEIEKDIPVSPELWCKLQEFGKHRIIKKNQYVLKTGEICQHGYYLNKGSLIQTYLHENGKEIVLGFYLDQEYAFVSSVNSYFTQHESTFELKAIEDCELIEYSKAQIEAMASSHPEFCSFYHRITASGLHNLYMFSAMRLSLSAEEFLQFLYSKHPIYLNTIPDKYIAQFMGVSKEWLSKLKKKIFKSGIA